MSFSPDGETLYIPGGQTGATVFAFDIKSQSIKWEFGSRRPIIYAIPLVDSEGNIYVISQNTDNDGVLYSMDKDGQIRWEYILGSFGRIDATNGFSLDRNGNIYVGYEKLLCIDYEGKLKWEYTENEFLAIFSPIVSDDLNNIFFIAKPSLGKKYLYAFNDQGDLLWQIEDPESNQSYTNFSPAIGYSNILIPGNNSSFIWSVK